jgi:hypothetical protein
MIDFGIRGYSAEISGSIAFGPNMT